MGSESTAGPPGRGRWYRAYFTGRTGRLRLVGVAAAVLIVAVAAFGVVLTKGSGEVVVSGVRFTVLEGKTLIGLPWLFPPEMNETSGFPITVASGQDFLITVTETNQDTVNHTVTRDAVGGGFSIVYVQPHLPYSIESHDDGTFTFTVQVPNANLGPTGVDVTLYVA